MKKMTRKGLLLPCIAVVLFACNEKKEESTASTTIDKEQVKKEIQAKEDEFASVYNSGVLRDIGYYADDATSFYQNRQPLVGKQAIVEFLKSGLDSNTHKISFKTNEVFASKDADLVVEIGSFSVVDSSGAPINKGNYMTLFEKRNGRYVAVRDMSTSDGSQLK